MKMEQIKLSEEASAYKKFMADMSEMNSAIESTSRLLCDNSFSLYIKFNAPFP